MTSAAAVFRLIIVLAIATGSAPRVLRADAVDRRGAEPRIVGEIVSADDAELVIRSTLGAVHRISWDRIRALEPAAHGENAKRLEFGEQLWRARSRVERHDTALAEPIFERLFENTRGSTSETALVVAEGLLRCRLARGANDGAVIPALEVARLRRSGIETASYALLPPILDAETSLCPRLPPAWVESRSLDGLDRDLGEYDARGDEVVGAIARLQRRALRAQLGLAPVEFDSSRGTEHAGVELLETFVQLGAAAASERSAARRRAQGRLDDVPPWAEAWLRFAIGSSLLHEPEQIERRRGLVELIHVPARYGSSQAYLAGLALAIVAEASKRDGDAGSANAVQAELARAFPDHPVLTAPPSLPAPFEAP